MRHDSLYNADMSQALTLFRLQQIDNQIDRALSRLAAIQATVDNDTTLQQAIKLAEQCATVHLEAEKQQNEAEADVQTQRIKIEQTEASLYGGKVRNPKELQDLQNETAAIKRHLATLEDRLLEAMLAVEQAEEKKTSAQADLLSAQEKYNISDLGFNQEKAILNKDLQKLNSERQAITGSLPADQLQVYEQLRHQRHGQAVSAVNENACNACGTTLTLAQVQASRSPAQIAFCPSCGRILYGS
jgi:uncharacterized protein